MKHYFLTIFILIALLLIPKTALASCMVRPSIEEDEKKAIELLKLSLTQVGYDEETKSFDIDKMTTGITSSKRSKILLVRETIYQLESRIGKMIPLEELQKALEGRIKPSAIIFFTSSGS